ncbi:MAG: DUF1178 family protein [Rhodocyclales bacterium]|jgi:hypothetical protein|nr:DUF1178 family protein [Rhodocyclales bacterium]
MIVLNLLCNNGHHFEGWFASNEVFHAQMAKRFVQCGVCQSDAITRLPSGPHVRRSSAGRRDVDVEQTTTSQQGDAVSPAPAKLTTASVSQEPERRHTVEVDAQAVKSLFTALATMARQAEDVGERLPEEARRIHYDEAPVRSIRGIATAEETRELLDEGILVLPVLVPPENETH